MKKLLILGIVFVVLFVQGTCEAAGAEDYSGMYYLHDELPRFGQNIGNLHDVGELRRSKPSHHDERYCSKWVQFDFDEPALSGVNATEEFNITSIYYHIWWKTVSGIALIGYQTVPTYDTTMKDFFSVDSNGSRSYLESSGYWLTTYKQDANASGKDIHDFTIKIVENDNLPSVISGPDHPSFIIINPEDDDVLKKTDMDNDTLSDYDEMYVYYTNPYDKDTDSDGLLDPEEIIEGNDERITDPNNFDTDDDGLLDGEDSDPVVSRYKKVYGDWIVTGAENVSGEYLQVEGNIIVPDGSSLTITDSSIKINTRSEQHRILVKKGGTLNIFNSKLRTDTPGHWYSAMTNTSHWHGETNIDIFGKAVIKDSTIEYGSEIQFERGSDVTLDNNDILYYRYGVTVLAASPTITNNRITPYVGNGILLSHASPVIKNNNITSYIGSGIVLIASSPTIVGGVIQGGSSDLYLTEDSHPVLDGVAFHENKNIIIKDGLSSVVYAQETVNTSETVTAPSSPPSSHSRFPAYTPAVIVLLGILALILIKRKR
ncbi:MAG: right-handed parallel beta-helix repeat-containing protein [Candidatus Hydrothermarchaeales archaeon]